jgi:hypothetical protein
MYYGADSIFPEIMILALQALVVSFAPAREAIVRAGQSNSNFQSKNLEDVHLNLFCALLIS